MDHHKLTDLALQLQRGEIGISDFVNALHGAPTADVEIAQVDVDRHRRCGFPEVVFGQGKSFEALERILGVLVARGVDAFATRIDPAQAEFLKALFADGVYNPVARTFRVPRPASESHAAERGIVAIVTAGTSDFPIAEEARETAQWMGLEVRMVHDVGVAGPHRLPAHLHKLVDADAVVVIAGMEGALPSVVGGYVSCPVIGVPTSVGYGASFGGLSALLGMLNSCASNVTVVNIDAGFKGAYVAGLIAQNAAKNRQTRQVRS
jgi:NCAIR mutase (PurE)-related protein